MPRAQSYVVSFSPGHSHLPTQVLRSRCQEGGQDAKVKKVGLENPEAQNSGRDLDWHIKSSTQARSFPRLWAFEETHAIAVALVSPRLPSCTEPSSSLAFLCLAALWDSPLESTSRLVRQSRSFFLFKKTKKSGPDLQYFLQCHVWFFLSIFLFSPSASCFPALSRPF
jgi:hypothetical protein